MDATTTISVAPPEPTYTGQMPAGFPLGCWLDGSYPGRALQAALFVDDSMTPTVCSQLCSNYALFGLEYGSECECGDSITPGSAFPVNDTRCQMPCSGDPSLTCGGSKTVFIYQSLPAPPAPPAGLFSNISYTPSGCVAEPSSGARALDGLVWSDDFMTPVFCAGICGMSNFMYFGVEYGRECWCGNSVAPEATLLSDSSQCNYPCAGDSTQVCGGWYTLNLYNGTRINTAASASGELQEALKAGLDGSRLGANMPVEDRFYRPEPRLTSLVGR